MAEDEEIVRTYLRDVLVDAGYEVLAAPDGKEASDLFATHGDRVILVITDVVMPVMNGRELHRFVTESRPGTPVVFTTGHSPDIIHRKGIFAEDFVFLRKPLSRRDLLTAVRKHALPVS